MPRDISTFTDEELRREIRRRERAEADTQWGRMKANAKYLCPDCGGPDSWHERWCPSDALDTAT